MEGPAVAGTATIGSAQGAVGVLIVGVPGTGSADAGSVRPVLSSVPAGMQISDTESPVFRMACSKAEPTVA
ncbi:hypothetical protein EDD29_2935 [Actinocorallia herbida]|uniref:Uncharacterized protein n=1 Tax=Actinocorallia herbida TaxID=58109 RepID=A0A3N1CVR3_9ACTN|nr:hypothetical protein EDD29_2935 [Actinocorallia herbida]